METGVVKALAYIQSMVDRSIRVLFIILNNYLAIYLHVKIKIEKGNQ